MLFTNSKVLTIKKNFSFGVLRGIVLGKEGVGWYDVFIPVPDTFPDLLKAGASLDSFIFDFTKNGRVRITEGKSKRDEIDVLLTTGFSGISSYEGLAWWSPIGKDGIGQVTLKAKGTGGPSMVKKWHHYALRVFGNAVIKLQDNQGNIKYCTVYGKEVSFLDEEGYQSFLAKNKLQKSHIDFSDGSL